MNLVPLVKYVSSTNDGIFEVSSNIDHPVGSLIFWNDSRNTPRFDLAFEGNCDYLVVDNIPSRRVLLVAKIGVFPVNPRVNNRFNGKWYLNSAGEIVEYPTATLIGFVNDGVLNLSLGVGSQSSIGSQGNQGNQGNQGFQGAQGSQGSTGAQGPQGNQGFQGAQGSQGNQGFQGFQGSQGVQGNQGFQGSQGSQGNQGDRGIGFKISKTYNTLADLLADTSPTGILPGEFAIITTADPADEDNGKLYLWTGTVYSYTTDMSMQEVEGPQGFQGAQGPQGNQGFQGSQGATGSQGNQGNQGNQGFQGTRGFQGFQGAQGAQGNQGNQGTQGFQGTQGSTGAQGFQGTRGFQGFQGAQGSTGSQGNQGFQGSQGATGSQGNQGNQGNQGAQGSIGSQGNQGFQGAQGATGSQGNQGFQGAQGSTGSQGNQGFQGAQGATGSQGNQGFQGAQGATGSQGNQGFQGTRGFQGFQGAQGSTGSQGNQGFQGAQGSTGSQGNQGFQGAQGATGSQGNQGFQGAQGATGSQGNQGFQGTRGFQGFQGAQGSTGSQGNQGFQGAQGSTGSQGNQGFQGAQGSTGSQGNQGFQGAQGTQGFQGSQGAQGNQGNQGFQGTRGNQGFQGFQGAQGNQGFQGPQGLQGNETITLSGEASGSGATSIAVTLSNSAVIGKVLTGYVVGANTALASTDTILGAFQKLQGQLNDKINGTGTNNYIPKFTGGKTIANSLLSDDGTTVTINGDLVITGSSTILLNSMKLSDRVSIGSSGNTNWLYIGNHTATASGESTKFKVELFGGDWADNGVITYVFDSFSSTSTSTTYTIQRIGATWRHANNEIYSNLEWKVFRNDTTNVFEIYVRGVTVDYFSLTANVLKSVNGLYQTYTASTTTAPTTGYTELIVSVFDQPYRMLNDSLYFRNTTLARGTAFSLSDLTQVANISYNGTSILASHKIQTIAGTTASASLRILSGVAPTTPASGDIWNDGSYLLYRNNTGTRYLTTTAGLTTNTIPKALGTGILGDSLLSDDGTNLLQSSGYFRNLGATSSDAAFVAAVTGDSLSRWVVYADGKIEWGAGGAASRDTNLYRASANLLKSDDNFEALSIRKTGGTSSQFLKADGSIDSNTYLTANQSITLSGEASGTGSTSISVTLANSAVIGKLLTGYVATSGVISATDSILTAFGKAQNQITNITSGIVNGTFGTYEVPSNENTGNQWVKLATITLNNTFTWASGGISIKGGYNGRIFAEIAFVLTSSTNGTLAINNPTILVTSSNGIDPSTIKLIVTSDYPSTKTAEIWYNCPSTFTSLIYSFNNIKQGSGSFVPNASPVFVSTSTAGTQYSGTATGVFSTLRALNLTTSYIPKATAGAFANSIISDDGTTVNIGNNVITSPRLYLQHNSGIAGGSEVIVNAAGPASDNNSGKLYWGGTFRMIGTTEPHFKFQRNNAGTWNTFFQTTSTTNTNLDLTFNGALTFNSTATALGSLIGLASYVNGQAIFGKTGQAGNIYFKRGSDGGLSARMGYSSATEAGEFQIASNGGSSSLTFQTAGVTRARFSTAGDFSIDAYTGNKALVSNGSKAIVESSVTSTELSYVSGVTSAIQSQFTGKVSKTGDIMSGSLSWGWAGGEEAIIQENNIFFRDRSGGPFIQMTFDTYTSEASSTVLYIKSTTFGVTKTSLNVEDIITSGALVGTGTRPLVTDATGNIGYQDAATFRTTIGAISGNQTITLSGEASGSGTTAITVTLANSAVIGKVLTGYVVGANSALAATDTILGAFQKTQGQINARIQLTSAITGYTVGANTALSASDTLLAALGKIQGQINARISGNQTITLSGVVTGSGTTAITTSIADGALSIAKTSGLQTALDGKVSTNAWNSQTIGIVAVANNFFNGSAVGDLYVRFGDSTKAVLLGVFDGASGTNNASLWYTKTGAGAGGTFGVTGAFTASNTSQFNGAVTIASSNSQVLFIGDDASFGDCNIVHTLRLRSTTNSALGYLQFGGSTSGSATDGGNFGYNGTDFVANKKLNLPNLNISSLTASTVVVTDGSKNLVSSGITTTKLNYLTDVTSNIQAQINGKQNTLTNPVTGTGTIWSIPVWTGSTTLGNSSISDNGAYATVYSYTRIAGNMDPASFTPPDAEGNWIGWNRNAGSRYFTLMSVQFSGNGGDAGFDFRHRKSTTETSLMTLAPSALSVAVNTFVNGSLTAISTASSPGIQIFAQASSLGSGFSNGIFVGKAQASQQSGGIAWVQGATDAESYLSVEGYGQASPVYLKGTIINAPNLILSPQTLTNFTNATRPTYRIHQDMATNDYWEIYGEGSVANTGSLVFETGDDANENFIWRMRNTGASLSYDRMTLGSSALTVNVNVNIPGLTASRVVVTDGSKNLASSSVTTTQLDTLLGISTAQTIQQQLNGKAGNTSGQNNRLTYYDSSSTIAYASKLTWIDTPTNAFYIGSTLSGSVGDFWSRYSGSIKFNDGTVETLQLTSTDSILNTRTAGSVKLQHNSADKLVLSSTGFNVLADWTMSTAKLTLAPTTIQLGSSTSVIPVNGSAIELPTPATVGQMLILYASAAPPATISVIAPSGYSIRYRNADATYVNTSSSVSLYSAAAIAICTPTNGGPNVWYLIW